MNKVRFLYLQSKSHESRIRVQSNVNQQIQVCTRFIFDKKICFVQFSKAREELKAKRGVEYSYPVLAFHGTAVANIQPICETGFKIPGQKGFKHATDSGYYGRGTYFSVSFVEE